jgi:drug/metabolite transporter (DMT)-like permease
VSSAGEPEPLALPPPRHAPLLIVAVLGVSFSGPLIAATVAPALAIAMWRNAFGAGAAGLLSALAALRRPARVRALPAGAVLTSMAGGAALALHFGTWVPSITMTSVASATALVSTQGIFAALIARGLGRRLPRTAWVGMAVATLGTALITGSDVGLSGRAVAGDVLAVIGGLGGAIYVTIGARARAQLSTATYTTICYSTCAVVLLIVCLIGGVRLTGFSADAWLKIVLVTVCAQLLGHGLLNVVLRTTSPTVVSLALLFETPGAAVIAYLWLGQRPPWSAVPGLVLLLVGLAVVARSRSPLAEEVEVTD